MRQPIHQGEPDRGRLPGLNPRAVLVFICLWLAFACGMPLVQLRDARRQAHQDLERVLTMEKLDGASVIAVFDHSNEHLDAAVSGACLLLAFAVIFLVNQLLKVKLRYNALARDLASPEHPGPASHDTRGD